jgi:hypothetical protein
MGTALQNTLDCIGDAFRPERLEYEGRITTTCQIRELVLGHRYTFQQALEKMDARIDWMLEAFDWVMLDNFALNEKHEHNFHLKEYQLETLRWLKQITGQE